MTFSQNFSVRQMGRTPHRCGSAARGRRPRCLRRAWTAASGTRSPTRHRTRAASATGSHMVLNLPELSVLSLYMQRRGHESNGQQKADRWLADDCSVMKVSGRSWHMSKTPGRSGTRDGHLKRHLKSPGRSGSCGAPGPRPPPARPPAAVQRRAEPRACPHR